MSNNDDLVVKLSDVSFSKNTMLYSEINWLIDVLYSNYNIIVKNREMVYLDDLDATEDNTIYLVVPENKIELTISNSDEIAVIADLDVSYPYALSFRLLEDADNDWPISFTKKPIFIDAITQELRDRLAKAKLSSLIADEDNTISEVTDDNINKQ